MSIATEPSSRTNVAVTPVGCAAVVSIHSTKAERLAKQGREAALRMMAATDSGDVDAEIPGQPTETERIRFAAQRMAQVENGPAPAEFKDAYVATAGSILTMVYGAGWEHIA